MLDGGADPLYVGRRMIRMATEDIGLADPRALPLALAAVETYERLGSPEGELALAEAVISEGGGERAARPGGACHDRFTPWYLTGQRGGAPRPRRAAGSVVALPSLPPPSPGYAEERLVVSEKSG